MNAVAKAQAEAYELVERYLHQVEENLPKDLRQDVIAELRPLLDESLQERALEAGRPPDEGIAVEVLRRFGKPEEAAAQYNPEPQFLIGPRMYPTFIHVARIVLIVLVCFYGAVLVISLAGLGKWSDIAADRVIGGEVHILHDVTSRITNTAVKFVQTVLTNLGILVVVFAILDRANRGKQAEEWDPRKLPALPEPEEDNRDRVSAGDRLFRSYATLKAAKAGGRVVSAGDRIFKIYATLVLAGVLNFYPQWFGITFITNEQIHSIPYWALGLNLPVLLLNIWWGGALALNVWLLKMGRWTREARWCEFGLGLFGLFIVWMIVTTSGPAQFDAAGWDSDAPRRLVDLARRGVPWAGRAVLFILKSVLIVGVIEALWRLYRIFTRYPLWGESKQA